MLRTCCTNPKVLCRKCHDKALAAEVNVKPWSEAAERREAISRHMVTDYTAPDPWSPTRAPQITTLDATDYSAPDPWARKASR